MFLGPQRILFLFKALSEPCTSEQLSVRQDLFPHLVIRGEPRRIMQRRASTSSRTTDSRTAIWLLFPSTSIGACFPSSFDSLLRLVLKSCMPLGAKVLRPLGPGCPLFCQPILDNLQHFRGYLVLRPYTNTPGLPRCPWSQRSGARSPILLVSMKLGLSCWINLSTTPATRSALVACISPSRTPSVAACCCRDSNASAICSPACPYRLKAFLGRASRTP